MSKLSQAIAEGDGISFIVEVSDSTGAKSAEAQGADGLAVITNANSVRMTSALPLLHLGHLFDAQGSASDAVVIKPDLAMWDEGHALGLECIVRVRESSELERVLRYFDPEVFLLSAPEDADDDDPLTVLLDLLHDVPAGKLAIAELHDATPEDVSELERSGVDAVLVSHGALGALMPSEPPEV